MYRHFLPFVATYIVPSPLIEKQRTIAFTFNHFSVMRSTFLLLVNLLIVPVHATHAQSAFEAHVYKDEKGDSILYQLLSPILKSPGKKFPMIVFLHGAGERGNDNEKQLTHGFFLFLNAENQERFPAFVLFPQCPSADYWASVDVDRSTRPHTLDFDYRRSPTQSFTGVMKLIDSLKHAPGVDAERIYLIGLSMGGMGTLEALYRRADLFSAAIAICGGADVQTYENFSSDVPLWMLHGALDDIVSVDHSRALFALLTRQKKTVRYTEYPTANHNSWGPAFAEAELLPWLFSWKRKKQK